MTRNCPDCGSLMELVDPADTPGPKTYECGTCFRSLDSPVAQ